MPARPNGRVAMWKKWLRDISTKYLVQKLEDVGNVER
jgi:hypothetical protein